MFKFLLLTWNYDICLIYFLFSLKLITIVYGQNAAIVVAWEKKKVKTVTAKYVGKTRLNNFSLRTARQSSRTAPTGGRHKLLRLHRNAITAWKKSFIFEFCFIYSCRAWYCCPVVIHTSSNLSYFLVGIIKSCSGATSVEPPHNNAHCACNNALKGYNILHFNFEN